MRKSQYPQKYPVCIPFRGCVLTVLREALDEAGVAPADIDAVAFTKGPGKTAVVVI